MAVRNQTCKTLTSALDWTLGLLSMEFETSTTSLSNVTGMAKAESFLSWLYTKSIFTLIAANKSFYCDCGISALDY